MSCHSCRIVLRELTAFKHMSCSTTQTQQAMHRHYQKLCSDQALYSTARANLKKVSTRAKHPKGPPGTTNLSLPDRQTGPLRTACPPQHHLNILRPLQGWSLWTICQFLVLSSSQSSCLPWTYLLPCVHWLKTVNVGSWKLLHPDT